jgi:hypothetical protein
MKKSALVILFALSAGFVAPPIALAQSPSTFRWQGVPNAPPEATETSYYLHHSKPRDPTVHDVYLQCRKGDAAIDATIVSTTKGGYAPDELMNKEVDAVFVVDGKRLAPVAVRLQQEESFGKEPLTLAIRYELEVDEPLFDALVKGKSFRFELPKAKSHTIPLAGFGKLALAMKKQCF